MLPQKANEAESRFERSPAPIHEVCANPLSLGCVLSPPVRLLSFKRCLGDTPSHTHPSFLSLTFIASMLFLMSSSGTIFVVVFAPAQAYRGKSGYKGKYRKCREENLKILGLCSSSRGSEPYESVMLIWQRFHWKFICKANISEKEKILYFK